MPGIDVNLSRRLSHLTAECLAAVFFEGLEERRDVHYRVKHAAAVHIADALGVDHDFSAWQCSTGLPREQ